MYDFYFSKKMLAITALSPLNRTNKISEVLLDGNWHRYTLLVDQGQEHGTNWDDIEFIGTTSDKNTRMVDFSQDDLMQLAVELRNDRIKSGK